VVVEGGSAGGRHGTGCERAEGGDGVVVLDSIGS
jgi:hypothetical protein